MKIVYNPYYLGILVLTVGKNENILPIRYTLIERLKKDGFWDETNEEFLKILTLLEERITGNEEKGIEKDDLYKDFLLVTNEKELKEKYPMLLPIFKELFKSNDFKALEEKNIEYIEVLKSLWLEKNEIEYLNYLLGISYDLSELEITVVPPYFEKNFYFENNISLACGKRPDKVLITLTHEILHHILGKAPNQKENDIRLAIIELLSENEINRKIYNEKYGTLTSNKELSGIIESVKQDFNSYVENNEGRNIFDFEKEMIDKMSVKRGI